MTLPDAETLLAELAEQIRRDVRPETALVGIYTGGVWMAERLHQHARAVRCRWAPSTSRSIATTTRRPGCAPG